MPKSLKHHDFSLHIERLFTSERTDAFDLIHFREPDRYGDEPTMALEAPDNWSPEATTLLAEAAACRTVPESTRLMEENTVPSWLWQRSGDHFSQMVEVSVRQIFHRVAGAATYAGWKKDLFEDEGEARAFFDEIRFMLAQRIIAIDPVHLAEQGLEWAYGIERRANEALAPSSPASFESGGFGIKGKPAIAEIGNASIDALLNGDREMRRKWLGFLTAGAKAGFLALRFHDIATDWAGNPVAPVRAALDLLYFRREDGSIDIARLQHAVKLLVVLFELQDAPQPQQNAIGYTNLAPLLMSQAIPYDSDAGRATAAAITAVITAEAYATSAQLAGLFGASTEFTANREGIIRALRNHRRAAYGDRNDYEKVSVLPVPLGLDPGADLALVAAARRRWDQVLELVQQHGLRFTRMTDLTAAPALAFFMESASEGIAPMPTLAVPHATDSGNYVQDIHPAVNEALVRLGYDADARRSAIHHIAGSRTLAHAPSVNHGQLEKRGFDDEAIRNVEDYLGQVNDIRLAVTPWIIGVDFCSDTLKIPADKLNDLRFDLLQHLGFSTQDIAQANIYCYGRGTAVGAKGLRPAHTGIFVHARETTADARIRMAAAVQGLISGDAGLQVTAPAAASDESARLLLTAWRQGVKSLAIEFAAVAKPVRRAARSKEQKAQAGKMSAAPRAAQHSPALRSALRSKPKASGSMVGEQSSGKAGGRKGSGSGKRGN